jgi:hypothetical protein
LLNYPRHFVLLLTAAAALTAVSRIVAMLAPGALFSAGAIASEFAIYGALHALALVSSLAARPALGRRISFVAAAAAMSLVTAWSTLVLARRMSNLSGAEPILIAAAALSAWAYALTIRRVLRLGLRARSLVWMSLGCGAAAAAAYPVAMRLPGAAGFALAVPWWLAFSVALALQDAAHQQ